MQVNAAQYLTQHAPWQMPGLISVLNVNKYLESDRPSETRLIHQRLAKQCDLHEQIQQHRYV
jgi:hypothetical protein